MGIVMKRHNYTGLPLKKIWALKAAFTPTNGTAFKMYMSISSLPNPSVGLKCIYGNVRFPAYTLRAQSYACVNATAM